MICYKDMTFCSAKCGTTTCHRNYTTKEHEDANKWWETFNLSGVPPVAFSDFSDGCGEYKPVDKENN